MVMLASSFLRAGAGRQKSRVRFLRQQNRPVNAQRALKFCLKYSAAGKIFSENFRGLKFFGLISNHDIDTYKALILTLSLEECM